MKMLIWSLMVLGLVVASNAYADIEKYTLKAVQLVMIAVLLMHPKGDVAIWHRLNQQKGQEALIKSIRQGMPQMPAMGLCQNCTDEDFAKLIDYMSR